MKLKIVIFIITFSIATNLFFEKTNNPFMYKQWYLNNDGNNAVIADSQDYFDYIQMETDADIKFLEMRTLLKTQDMSKEVIVAVIDTGVDFNHEDLKDAMWVNKSKSSDDKTATYGFNFCNNTDNIFESKNSVFENSHGTKCAGIIAARDNKVGIVGVASMANVKIMSLKILESEQNLIAGELDNLIRAIKYAESNGALLCNVSLSTELYSKDLESTIKGSKMLFVASAGNGTVRGLNIDKIPVYPAAFNFENVITVANLNYNGTLNKSSNFGPLSVDLAAPGTCIYSTSVNNTYSYGSGTSMAAPIVTGVAALVYSQFDYISASDVKEIILHSTTQKEEFKNMMASSGMINGAETIKNILMLKNKI